MTFLKKFKVPKINLSSLKFPLIYKRQIIILFLFSLVSSGFFLIGPYLSKLFIDKAFIGRNLDKFLSLSVLGVLVFIFSTLVKAAEDIIKNRLTVKLKLDLANRFIRKLYSLDLEFLQSKSVGENAYRFSDTERITRFILEQCPGILADIFKLPIILGIALWINAPMAVFLLILSPLFLFHSAYIRKKIRPIYEGIWKYGAIVAKEIHEAFSRILIIRALGLETHQRHIYLRSLIKNIRWRIKSFRWAIISSLSSSFLSKAIYGAITLYGGWLIIKGRITLGSYTAVMLYLTQSGALLQSLGNRFEYAGQEIVSLEKFLEIMDSQPRIKDLPGARALSFIKGEIRFKDLWFGYQKEKPIFKGINLTIPAFSWIGIVGPSGCGKTTLVNLILRLYEPWEGEILLDGFDLRGVSLGSLREKITIATQQPLLFDLSIRENIAYGLKSVSQAEIIEAAKIAYADEFIQELPQGYDTFIGEDACCLSHGLKQRIAIARAIIRNPHLLILDEATSSVDSHTEGNIFKALRQKREGLSTIVISHRLFSIRDADRIYFLRQGDKIEEGTHLELSAKSNFYREFFRNQMKIEEQNAVSIERI